MDITNPDNGFIIICMEKYVLKWLTYLIIDIEYIVWISNKQKIL